MMLTCGLLRNSVSFGLRMVYGEIASVDVGKRRCDLGPLHWYHIKDTTDEGVVYVCVKTRSPVGGIGRISQM